MEHLREIDFRFLAEPTDVNFGGKVHGGMVMKWMDQAGYACASQWSGHYCVTVSVGGIRFKRPIHVGHLVTLNAKIVHTGSTSMHIFISVKSGVPTAQFIEETCTCIISFVAMDDDGRPTSVEQWVPVTEEDKLLEQIAIHAREFSQRLQAEIED